MSQLITILSQYHKVNEQDKQDKQETEQEKAPYYNKIRKIDTTTKDRINKRNEDFLNSHDLGKELTDYIIEQGFERVTHVPWSRDVFRNVQRHIDRYPIYVREDGYAVTSDSSGNLNRLIKITNPKAIKQIASENWEFSKNEILIKLGVYEIPCVALTSTIGGILWGTKGMAAGALVGSLVGGTATDLNFSLNKSRSVVNTDYPDRDYRFAEKLVETISSEYPGAPCE